MYLGRNCSRGSYEEASDHHLGYFRSNWLRFEHTEFKEISLGYVKKQVLEEIGEPTVARGAITNKFGQCIEVWEYKLALPTDETAGTIIGKSVITFATLGMGAVLFKGERKNYWLYFMNDKLVQWGEAGDWRREADRIYEVQFTTAPALTK